MSAATATKPPLTRITATVLELHAKSGDNWSRAKVQFEDGRTAWITAKFRLNVDETVEADCTYNEKFRSYDVVKLVGDESGKVSNAVIILKLVEVLDGVGAVKARRLGEKFPELYTTLIEHPEEIAAACGTDVENVKQVALLLEGERAVLSRVTTLIARGFPQHLAKRISGDDRQYVTALESPYAAIKLVSGLGWLIADEIGRKQGIVANDPKRIVAGIDHYYRESVANDGHTVVHGDSLLELPNIPALLGIAVKEIAPLLEETLLPTGDGWYTSENHRKNAGRV